MDIYESIETCNVRALAGTTANINNKIINILGAHNRSGFILPVSGDVIAKLKKANAAN